MATSSPKRSAAKPSARSTSSASGRRPAGTPSSAKKKSSRPPATERSSRPSTTERSSRPPTTERSDKPSKKAAAKRKSTRSKPIHDHTASPREEQDGVRLQKYLASAGVASRRAAEALIVGGHVQVNGRVVTELGTRVFDDRDRVTLRGELIKPEAKVYYLLNKPDAVVSSAAGSVDERGRPTVLSLMHGIRERLYPVGRLDYHSRGVLLLTNDGELAEALTHPRHGVVKTYHVKFQGKLTDEEEQALREGVELDDGAITRPLAELFAFRETGSNCWYQIGLTEGLNRQIRRMGDAINHPVLKLLRVAIGDITTDGLEEGQFRPLKPTEVAQLLAAVRIAPEPSSKPAKVAGADADRPARVKKSSRRPAAEGAARTGDRPVGAKKASSRTSSRAASSGESSRSSSTPERASRSSAPERSNRSSAPDRPSRSSTPEKSSRSSTPEKSSRSSAPERSSRSSAPERSSRSPASKKSSRPPAAKRSAGGSARRLAGAKKASARPASKKPTRSTRK